MARNNFSITICIPTYNRNGYIGQTIQSVLNQTYRNFELLIINDASTDNTEEIIKSFKDERIHYVKNTKNIGYVKTMNKGTKLAKGDWIMHLSDDDLLLPDLLEKQVKVLDENKKKTIGFVVPQSTNIDADGAVISVPPKQLNGEEYVILEPKEFIFNFTLYGKQVRDKYHFNTSFPSTLFNRSVLIEMGGSSEKVPVSHDIYIESKICLLYPVIIIDKPLFQYRVHENWGSSLNQKGEFLKEYLAFLNLLFNFIKEKNISFPYDFKKYCYDSLIRYLFALNGGVVKTAARFRGGYIKRVSVLKKYFMFGIGHRKSLLLDPRFYIVLIASFAPQIVLLTAGKLTKQI